MIEICCACTNTCQIQNAILRQLSENWAKTNPKREIQSIYRNSDWSECVLWKTRQRAPSSSASLDGHLLQRRLLSAQPHLVTHWDTWLSFASPSATSHQNLLAESRPANRTRQESTRASPLCRAAALDRRFAGPSRTYTSCSTTTCSPASNRPLYFPISYTNYRFTFPVLFFILISNCRWGNTVKI